MKRHLPVEPLGPAPWSPWRTACGREIMEDLLPHDLREVDCRACMRSLAYRQMIDPALACTCGRTDGRPAISCPLWEPALDPDGWEE